MMANDAGEETTWDCDGSRLKDEPFLEYQGPWLVTYSFLPAGIGCVDALSGTFGGNGRAQHEEPVSELGWKLEVWETRKGA